MRISRWQPEERAEPSYQRPWLEAPSPYDYLPAEPPRAATRDDEDEDSEPRRVIIIEI